MSKRNTSAIQAAAIIALMLAAFWAGIDQVPAQQEAPVTTALFPPHPLYGPFIEQVMLSSSCVVTASVPMDCWGHDDEIVGWEEEGLVDLVSTSIEDFAGGDGAATVVLLGIGLGGSLQTEIVSLSGTTPVQSVLQYKSPLSILLVDSVGSGGDLFNEPVAVGNIGATIGGLNAGIIRTDRIQNQSLTGGVRIGKGVTAVLTRLIISARQLASGGTGNAEVRVLNKLPSGPWLGVLAPIPLSTGGLVSVQIDTNAVLVEESLIRFFVISEKDVEIRISFLATIYGVRS